MPRKKLAKEKLWQGWYKELSSAWWQHRDSTMAAAIAYRALFSLVPLMMALLVVVNLIEASQKLFQQVAVSGGEMGRELIEQAMRMTEVNRDWLSLPPAFLWVMVLVMLYGASTGFRELTLSLMVIFGTNRNQWWRGNIWAKLGAFLMILGVGGVLIIFTFASWGLSAIENVLSVWLPTTAMTMDYFDWVLTPLLLFGFMVLIYRWLPLKQTPFKILMPGALAATLLLWGGQSLMAVLIKNASAVTMFGAAGWTIGFLLWVYYSSLIVLLGAEIAQLTGRRREVLK